ncbi:unnamed protein product [Chrysodeixis includens]|uniref:Adenosine deaminase n=1 Tax=Chrysodeixis includens TaxID=689277 RepID=A0A9P0BUP2_CHRIL|nr:unnamed protein product [Chrysodeixis includens]
MARLIMWPLVLLLTAVTVTSKDMIDKVLDERKSLFDRELGLMLGSNMKLSDSEIKANDIIMALKVDEVERGLEHPKDFNLSKHFFEYKDIVKDTKLFKMIKKMPKGAVLHAHDTGILGPDYVLKLTYMDNLYISFDGDNINFKFSKTAPKTDTSCGCDWKLLKQARAEAKSVADFDAELRKYFTIVIDNPNEVYTDVNTVWKRFQQYFISTGPLFTYKPVWEKYYYDTLVAMREDNVMYFEIRTILPDLYDLDGNTYNAVETAKIYKKVTEKFQKDYPDFFGAKLIYAPLKVLDKPTLHEYIRTAKEIKKLMPDFFAGFDLVGQEDIGAPLRDVVTELCDAGKDLDLFLHAGETNWSGTSSDENLFEAVVLGAKRIGHGFALIKHPVLMEEVKRRGIAIEVNPVSNAVLKLVEDVRNHPLAAFLSQNMPVVISCDDPGVWEADPLTHDFYITFVAISSRHADLRLLKQLALNSLYFSTHPNKDKLVHEFEIRWTKFIDSVVKNRW